MCAGEVVDLAVAAEGQETAVFDGDGFGGVGVRGVETAVGEDQVRGMVADLHGTPLCGLGFVGAVLCACPMAVATRGDHKGTPLQPSEFSAHNHIMGLGESHIVRN